MKTITIVCTWESRHEVEVSDNYEIGTTGPDWFDQVDAHTAALADWEER